MTVKELLDFLLDQQSDAEVQVYDSEEGQYKDVEKCTGSKIGVTIHTC